MSLYSEAVGLWEYSFTGVGVRPGGMEVTRITATLGQDGTSFLSWRNPFIEAVKVPVLATCLSVSASVITPLVSLPPELAQRFH